MSSGPAAPVLPLYFAAPDTPITTDLAGNWWHTSQCVLGLWVTGALRSDVKEEPGAQPRAGDSRGAEYPAAASQARYQK